MSTLQVDSAAPRLGGTSTNLMAGLMKAWANADGSATVSDSLNVSSSTDHGVGDYSYNLTNAYSGTDYVQASDGDQTVAIITNKNSARYSASVMAAEFYNSAGTNADTAHGVLSGGTLA